MYRNKNNQKPYILNETKDIKWFALLKSSKKYKYFGFTFQNPSLRVINKDGHGSCTTDIKLHICMYDKVLPHSVTNQIKVFDSFHNFIEFTDKSSFVASRTAWVIKILA